MDLVALCKVLLLSIIDFGSIVYHSILSGEQRAKIEHLQRTALQIVYGGGMSYRRLLEVSGLPRVSERRIELLDCFILKAARNEKIQGVVVPKKGVLPPGPTQRANIWRKIRENRLAV